ncbi:hypothetical protein SESBI_00599 [Sesbania bispinosa]|nr:hypothetical protein SESBI_00599 [Sesbania bispinosa]
MKELTGLTEEDDISGPHVKRKKRRNQPIFDEYGPSQNVDESRPTQNVDEEGVRGGNATVNEVPAATEVPHSIEAEFVPKNISNMHQIDDDYSTEDLENVEESEATTNVQATNEEPAASTPLDTNNGAATNEDRAASTVAPVIVENQPRPRGRPRTRNATASSSQNVVVSTASKSGAESKTATATKTGAATKFGAATRSGVATKTRPTTRSGATTKFGHASKSGSTSKTTTISTKKAVVPKTIASKSKAATKTASASKTATASTKNATASASNNVTSASKGKNVSRKTGHGNYQNQPFILPFAQDKTVASCLAHLMCLNSIWAHKLMMKEGQNEPDLDLKDQRVKMKQIWMYQILMEIKFDESGVQHMGRIVGSFV